MEHLKTSIVNVSFRYQEGDYVRALRAHYRSRLRLPMDFAVMIILVSVGVHFWRSPNAHWLGVVFVCVSAAFAIILIAAFTVIPRLIFRSDPKFRDEYLLTFSPEGIHFRTSHIDSHLQWKMYTSALVTAHSYVLYYGSRTFTVIPKKVFASAEEQVSFEEMLIHNVPQIVRK